MRYILALVMALAATPAGAQLTVTNSADSGPGTLRDAIETANLAGSVVIVDFQLPEGEDVIRPASALPTITAGITFMGTGAPVGYSNHITLSGENAGDSNGLTIMSPAVTVDGLTIVNFQRSGIVATGAQMGIQILNCFIGTDGTQCLGNNHHGILFENGVSESNIRYNVISGNGYDGIRLYGQYTFGNYIAANLIGTDASGTLPIGNGWRSEGVRGIWTNPKSPNGPVPTSGDGTLEYSSEGVPIIDSHLNGGGILIAAGANGNTIGDGYNANGNTISGNYWYGVKIVGPGSDSNRLYGNRIGVDVTGQAALPNEEEGILVRYGAQYTNIGLEGYPVYGNTIGANNVGIMVDGPGVLGTQILGNYIGTALDPAMHLIKMPNRLAGIFVQNGPAATTIGDGTAESQNYIYYNNYVGIHIKGNSQSNSVRRSLVGGNVGEGILVDEGANHAIAPPVLTLATATQITGTALPGATIDVYADPSGQGGVFLATGSADINGDWTISGIFAPYIGVQATAIQTDPASLDSSPFSAPLPIDGGGGEGEGEGEGQAPFTDFTGALSGLRTNPLAKYLPEPFRSYLFGLDEQNGDFNGGVSITVTALPTSNKQAKELLTDSLQFVGNGIPDSQELGVIAYLLEHPAKKTAKLSGANLLNGYQHNCDMLRNHQLGPRLSKPIDLMLPGIIDLMAAYSLLGDGEITTQSDNTLVTTGGYAALKGYFKLFAPGTKKLGAITGFNPEILDQDFTKFPELGPDGDLDGDGATNLEEWKAFGPDHYLEAILDPNIKPSGEGEGEGQNPEFYGTVDANRNHIISLSELLRVIQFYNSGGIHCAVPASSTEDGYAPGPVGDQTCTPYVDDYNPQNWLISLSELLRVIQFYNAGGYRYCPASNTEDGYCPGLV